MKLRTKINGLILLNLLFVLLLVTVSLSFIMVHREYDEAGQNALTVAKTVAGLPEVIQAFKEPNPLPSFSQLLKIFKKNRVHNLL